MGIGVSLYRNMTVNNSIGFLGEYEVLIDAKNRFLVPAGFRKQLPEGAEDRFVINRGFENCLTVYTIESWSKLSEQIHGEKVNVFPSIICLQGFSITVILGYSFKSKFNELTSFVFL